MFGYLTIYKDELKVKHAHEHQIVYCSLCYLVRKKYGLPYAVFLRYEPVFLYFLLDDGKGRKESLQFRCPMNPLKLITSEVNYDVLEFIAFINMLLVIHKCQDDYLDTKNKLKIGIRNILRSNKAFHIDMVTYYDLDNELQLLLERFHNGEKNYMSIDESMRYMGDYLSEIVHQYYLFYRKLNIEDSVSAVMSFSNEIGKWVYIMDAVDDYEKDLKDGCYNPIVQISNNEKQKTAIIILGLLQTKAHKKLLKLTLFHNEIIENYVKYGLSASLKKLLKKKEEKEHRRQRFFQTFSNVKIRILGLLNILRR